MNYKPLKGRLIVGVNLEQKQSYSINTPSGPITLYMGHEYNIDNKVSQPNICKVHAVAKDITDIKKGDMLLVDYLTFAQFQQAGTDQYGLIEKIGDESIFSIEYSMCEMKFDENMVPHPIKDFAIVERLYEPPMSTIIIEPNPKQMERHFRVLEMGVKFQEEYGDVVNSGDVVICYKNSDIDINYTLENKKHTITRIRSIDVLGKDDSQKNNFHKPQIFLS